MKCEKCGTEMYICTEGFACDVCLRVVKAAIIKAGILPNMEPYEPTWEEIQTSLYAKLSPSLQDIADLAHELSTFYVW